jgi:hypothetical protein
MQRLGLAVLLILALVVSACGVTMEDGRINIDSGRGSVSIVKGSGQVTTESRQVSGFSGLSLSGLGEVSIRQGGSESLTIEAEDNILPQISTEVRGGVLYIGFKNRTTQETVIPTKPIRYTLSVKDLTSVESSGAGSIAADGLKTSALHISLLGVGGVKINGVSASTVSSTLSGAGSVDLAGQISEQTVALAGVGSYRAGDLKSQKAKITISGAGSATVWVSESLDATITGAGSVQYYGSPSVTKSVTGAGNVKSLGAK